MNTLIMEISPVVLSPVNRQNGSRNSYSADCIPFGIQSANIARRNGGNASQARGNHRVSDELNRLLAAAMISTPFREKLLSTPDTAIATGYNGETFSLTPEEWDLVISIQAATLVDFVEQLAAGSR